MIGSLLQIASPSILLGVGAVSFTALIYAYRRRGLGERISVGSVFLLKQLKQSPPFRSTFHPPPRFFIEALFVGALAAAIAGAYQAKSEDSVAVLIDNSAGMSATAGASSGDASLLATLLESLRAEIYSLGSGTEVSLYITSPQLTRIAEGDALSSAVEDGLATVQTAPAPDNLSPALTTLAKSGEFDQIIVGTDKRGGASPQATQYSGSSITFISPYEPGSTRPGNVGITDISIHGGADSKGAPVRTIDLRVDNFNPVSLSGQIGFSIVNGEGVEVLLQTTPVTLGKGETRTVSFANVPESTAYKLALSVPHATGGVVSNSLLFDDAAWITTTTPSTRLVVIGNTTARRLGLNSLSTFESSEIVPGTEPASWFEEGTGESLVYYKTTPQKLPRRNTLFVLPPDAGSPTLFSGLGLKQGASITGWKDTHPILTYANITNLKLTQSLPLRIPAWAEPLIRSDAGPILAAGEMGGNRYAAVGFELFPFEGRGSPTISILTLNTLKWLSDLPASSGYRSTFTPFVASEQGATVRAPSGESFRAEKSRGPAVPGLYRLDSGGNSKTIAVNFLSTEESNSLESDEISPPPLAPKGIALNARRSLATDIVLWVIALLCIDILISALRGRVPKFFHRSESIGSGR